MNQKIKDHVVKYCEKNGWGTTDEDIWETIIECGEELHKSHIESYRWWDVYFLVVELDGMMIGLEVAGTTGDESPEEKGWIHDYDSICEVERKEQIVYVYTPKTSQEDE